MRDRAILALLLGCGLRRGELASLRIDQLQQREGRWCIIDLKGKHGRVRTVPVPAWVKHALDAWIDGGGLEDGRVFQALNKAGSIVGECLSERAIWDIVRAYATSIGITGLAPHDLRRTCAKLCRGAGGELEQIRLLLGHASIQTIERYLGTKQNISRAPNDAIAISL